MATITVSLPRVLNPVTDPTGWIAAAGAVYAVAVMAYNAFNNHGILDPAVITAAVGAVLALFARTVVTPTADPKNGIGQPLAPVAPLAPGTYGTPAFIQVTPNPTGGTVGQPGQ